jgi:probable F420-dependent oxidoreductase
MFDAREVGDRWDSDGCEDPGRDEHASCAGVPAMRFGVAAGNFGNFGSEPGVAGCLAVAEEAERLGFDSVWVHDHVVMPSNVRSRYLYNTSGDSPFRPDQYIYDPLAVMAAIAARTERVEIGTSVLIVPYRNPLVLAKTLSTIDHISRGRVILGIGVGWMAEEFDALGLADQYEQRGRVTDEYMAVCIDLWTQDGPSSFDGEWVSYRDVGANPLPVRRPHIPIWVGGKSPPALRRVARYGSGYHAVGSTPAELADEIATVHAAMEIAGRDPAELTVSMLWGFLPSGTSEEMIDLIGRYEQAGLHHLVGVPVLHPTPPPPTDPAGVLQATLEELQRFASTVMPQLQ